MIALVTGSSAGLGLEVARELLRKNYAVIINGRDKRRLEAAKRELGERPLIFAADVSDAQFGRQLDEFLKKQRIVSLDVVVHSAGVNHMGRVLHINPQNAARTFAANSLSVIHVAQATEPYLGVTARPCFIYVSSLMKYLAMPNRSVYAASKAAGEQIAEAWGIELRGAGSRIQVKIFRPAGIETSFHSNTATDGSAPKSNVSRMSAEKAARHLLALIESNRREAAPGVANKVVAFVARHMPRLTHHLLKKRSKT